MVTKAELHRQAMALPAEERVEFVVDLWDSIGAEALPLPDWQRKLILRRVEELDSMDPEERSTPWEDVRGRVFSRRA